jgi:hypothetical protein
MTPLRWEQNDDTSCAAGGALGERLAMASGMARVRRVSIFVGLESAAVRITADFFAAVIVGCASNF